MGGSLAYLAPRAKCVRVVVVDLRLKRTGPKRPTHLAALHKYLTYSLDFISDSDSGQQSNKPHALDPVSEPCSFHSRQFLVVLSLPGRFLPHNK